MNGADFPRGVVEAFPYAVHTVLTDNGMAFADLSRLDDNTRIFKRDPRHLIPGPNTWQPARPRRAI